MGMKTANEDVYARIKSGSSTIAAGVRLKQPDLETKGREIYAEAIIENAVRLYAENLTATALARLTRLMYDLQDDSEEDATADAEETTQELQLEDADLSDLRQAITPVSILAPLLDEDPDDEYEEDFE